jgi:hypothetical protein
MYLVTRLTTDICVASPPSPTLVGAAPFRGSTKPEHTQHSMCNNERRGGRSNPTNSVSYCALSTSCKQVRVPVVGLGRVSLHVAPPNVSGPKIIARRYVLVFGTTVFGLAAPPTYTTPPKNPTFRYHVVCRIRSNNHIHFFRCWLVGRTCFVKWTYSRISGLRACGFRKRAKAS